MRLESEIKDLGDRQITDLEATLKVVEKYAGITGEINEIEGQVQEKELKCRGAFGSSSSSSSSGSGELSLSQERDKLNSLYNQMAELDQEHDKK